ncbi:24697_t:CDS:2 [Cetraspora pellucida]|uniref:24697_t:CDS:1 n=1 Tax=Cetraspora pellucida TaxID=1433469 RepID=A0A9N9FGU4_9GLOM|nr:24697_t:CDS:2 [Cetraspora pellucida]
MSKTSPFTNLSFASSLSSLLENIEMYDDNNEYVPILTFCQYFLNDSDSDNENKDENAADTSVPKRKRKQALQLAPPPTFEPLVHPSPLRRTMGRYNLQRASCLGCLGYLSGLFKLPSHNQYWNEDPRLLIHQISKQMIFKCFESIKRFFHVSSSALTSILKNYFNKVELLLSHICEASKQYYTPESNVSVDKMIIRFSEKSIHTVRMKNKPVLEGFKIFSLCESGYTYTFLPTSYIASSNVAKVNSLTKVGSQVLHLVEQLPYKQYSYNIYINNYFTSVPLFQHLRQISVGACGTVRKTVARFPKELKVDKGAKLDWDVRSGVEVNGALAIFWQDNGPVTMLSTIHSLVGEKCEIEQERW